MNGKRAKAIRKLAKFIPNDQREYGPLHTYDHNGKPLVIKNTRVSSGTRRDYKLLKQHFQGKDVILPKYLKD